MWIAGDVSRDITVIEMSIMSKLTEAVLQNAAAFQLAVNMAAQLGINQIVI
jgi:flagellar motor switch protein FliM